MSDITHNIINNQFSDSASIIQRGQYFLMKKLMSVAAGTPTSSEKVVLAASLSAQNGSVLNMSNPFLFTNANANIESNAVNGTVAAITDEDYAAAADVIWNTFVKAFG